VGKWKGKFVRLYNNSTKSKCMRLGLLLGQTTNDS